MAENEQLAENSAFCLLDLSPDEYIAVDYEGSWYIGKVLGIDEENGEVHVSFMKSRKDSLYTWARLIKAPITAIGG
jgi:hypothetical protein